MSGQMTIGQAAEYLGVSRTKVWKLIGEGALSASINPLDKREKLIPAREVEHLRRAGRAVALIAADRPRFHSDGIASNPDAPRSDQLEDYLRDFDIVAAEGHITVLPER